jgi:hypothetical protein
MATFIGVLLYSFRVKLQRAAMICSAYRLRLWMQGSMVGWIHLMATFIGVLLYCFRVELQRVVVCGIHGLGLWMQGSMGWWFVVSLVIIFCTGDFLNCFISGFRIPLCPPMTTL